jgi:tRNA threonylcarbamoyladenosine biosynthesis protein TsaB
LKTRRLADIRRNDRAMPTLLAIDTATEACSAALGCNGAIIERSEIAPRRHAELILPMIESLLAEAGLARRDLDGIAVGRGPGAFTGVRLAISVAQGLALGLDVPVVPVSSLAALALAAPAAADEREDAILAAIDARMGEVYAGAFRRTADGLVGPLCDETVGPAEKWNLPQNAQNKRFRWSVVGTGWEAYREALAARLTAPPAFADGACYPRARAVLRLAMPRFERGEALAPEAALPVYLRDKVALTLGEQGRGTRGEGGKAQ